MLMISNIYVKNNVYNVVNLDYKKGAVYKFSMTITPSFINGVSVLYDSHNNITTEANSIEECYQQIYAKLYSSHSIIPPKNG